MKFVWNYGTSTLYTMMRLILSTLFIASGAFGTAAIKKNTIQDACSDSTGVFKWINQQAVSCEWVSENKELGTCTQSISKKHCPLTCGQCSVPVYDEPSIIPQVVERVIRHEILRSETPPAYRRQVYSSSMSMRYHRSRRPSYPQSLKPTAKAEDCSNVHVSIVTVSFESTMSLTNIPSPSSQEEVSTLSSLLKVAIESNSSPGSTVIINKLAVTSLVSIEMKYTTSISATCSGEKCVDEGETIYFKAQEVLSNAFTSGGLLENILKSFSTPMNIMMDPQSWSVQEPVTVVHTLPYPKSCWKSPTVPPSIVKPMASSRPISQPWTVQPSGGYLHSAKPSMAPARNPSQSVSSPPSIPIPAVKSSIKPSSSSPFVTPLPSVQQSAIPTAMSSSHLPSVFPSTMSSMSPTEWYAIQTAAPISAPTSTRPKPTTNPSTLFTSPPQFIPMAKPTTEPLPRTTFYPTIQSSTDLPYRPTGETNTKKPTIEPSYLSTFYPTTKPTTYRTHRPVAEPIEIQTTEPSSRPTFHPTKNPSANPIAISTREPSSLPTFDPTTKPSAEHTFHSTAKPTARTTSKLPARSTSKPTAHSTSSPSTKPTAESTSKPAARPTSRPTTSTTTKPTAKPRDLPIAMPIKPSSRPTFHPTKNPSANPIAISTREPSSLPTFDPTTKPSAMHTFHSTAKPTSKLPARSTSKPTADSTSSPSTKPTAESTSKPAARPTTSTTAKPTTKPTAKPRDLPIAMPTAPTVMQTDRPSGEPRANPFSRPSREPTTQIPNNKPFTVFTSKPTTNPASGSWMYNTPKPRPVDASKTPSMSPAAKLSARPTHQPTTDSIVNINFESSIQLSNIPNPLPSGEMNKIASILKSSIESVSLPGSVITVTKIGAVSVKPKTFLRVLVTTSSQQTSVVFNTSLSSPCSGSAACKETGDILFINSTSTLSQALSSGSLVKEIVSTATSQNVSSLKSVLIDPDTLVVSAPLQTLGRQSSASQTQSGSTYVSDDKKNMYFLLLIGLFVGVVFIAYKRRKTYIETSSDVKIYHDLIEEVEAISVKMPPSFDRDSFIYSSESVNNRFVLRPVTYFNPLELAEINKFSAGESSKTTDEGTLIIKPVSPHTGHFFDIDLNEYVQNYTDSDSLYLGTCSKFDENPSNPFSIISSPRGKYHINMSIDGDELNLLPALSTYPSEKSFRQIVPRQYQSSADELQVKGDQMKILHEVYDANNNADILNDSFQVEASILDLTDAICDSPTNKRRYKFSDTMLL